MQKQSCFKNLWVILIRKWLKKVWPWRPAFIVTGGHLALAFEFWSKIFFTDAVLEKNEFSFYELERFFNQNVTKKGSSTFKGQKGQILFLLKFGKKSFQLIKGKFIFFQNCIWEKKNWSKFKGQGQVTPCNYEGRPSRPNFFL